MAYYRMGEAFNWFIARVVDFNDPERLGRLKIRVIHDQTGEIGKWSGNDVSTGVPDDELLWAWTISSIQSASLASAKIREDRLEGFEVPDWIDAVGMSPTGTAIGTYVFGFYLDGKEQNIPMVFGSYHKQSITPEPPTDPKTGEFLQLKAPTGKVEANNDVTDLTGANNTVAKTKWELRTEGDEVKEPFLDKSGDQYSTLWGAQYPYNLTYTTKSGHIIEVDDSPGAERLHMWHKSGTYDEISPAGERVTKTIHDNYTITSGNNYVLIDGKETLIELTGKCRVVCSNTITIETVGDVHVESKEGNLSVETKKGDMSFKSKGNMNIESEQNMRIKAKRLDINP